MPLLESLTSWAIAVIHSNMSARKLLNERIVLDDETFVELVIWKLPKPAAASSHLYKYRLALVRQGVCVMRYDNEAGKGDHRHLDQQETDYIFTGLEQLQRDFWTDVERWRLG